MRVVYCFLAQAATHAPDVGLSVLSADFDTIKATQFPATHPAMALVAKIAVPPETEGQVLQMGIRIIGEDGMEMFETTQPMPVRRRPGGRSTGEIMINVIAQFQQLTFPSAGEYSVRLSIDGRELASLPLHLVAV